MTNSKALEFFYLKGESDQMNRVNLGRRLLNILGNCVIVLTAPVWTPFHFWWFVASNEDCVKAFSGEFLMTR